MKFSRNQLEIKMTFRKIALGLTLLAALSAHAQTQSPINNGPGNIDQQVIGDTVNSADRTNSTTNQIGNSAASNGNDLSTATDIRTQISPTTTSTALGANLALGNNSDAHASNGPQTMGQANTGTVGNTTAAGGAGGQGGQGGAATSNGTNLGINGQQQGIDRSGNSANNVQGGDQRNAQNTSAGNGAGAGAGAGNTTKNTTVVEGDTDRSKTTFTTWANPIIHGAAAAALPTAQMAPVVRACGPRFRVFQTPVVGVTIGPFGGHKEVILGYKDNIGPYLNEDGTVARESYGIENVYDLDADGKTVLVMQRLKGMEALGHATVLSTSSMQSFSGGVFSKGEAVQGGAAGGGGMQQQSQMINAFECVKAERMVVVEPKKTPPADRSHGPTPRADRN